MTTTQIVPGNIIERQVSKNRYELVEIVALPGDEGHFCGGASNPEDFIVVRSENGVTSPLHRLYLAPKFVRSIA